jgi:two-component system response regulator YesN
MANSEAINFIKQSFYLYEIIAFLSTQFEMIMSSIGYSSKDSIIDDIVHYIDHNYPENITLENIAPLFGYNSSYLGKIFSKKMGINFNSYLDNIRIEHSKELLKGDKTQVYKIAELVGYRNVDYFHIKFKKSTGITPAEFRKQNK